MIVALQPDGEVDRGWGARVEWGVKGRVDGGCEIGYPDWGREGEGYLGGVFEVNAREGV